MLASVHRRMNSSPGISKSVLIVEKQPNYTQLLVKQVLFAELRPLVAVTAEGGLRKALEFHPDLVLLELDLTDMHGLQFVSQMREHQRLQNIPIIVMSIFPHLKAAALNGGCQDFLQKPVKMIDLMGRIRRCLTQNDTAKHLENSASSAIVPPR